MVPLDGRCAVASSRDAPAHDLHQGVLHPLHLLEVPGEEVLPRRQLFRRLEGDDDGLPGLVCVKGREAACTRGASGVKRQRGAFPGGAAAHLGEWQDLGGGRRMVHFLQLRGGCVWLGGEGGWIREDFASSRRGDVYLKGERAVMYNCNGEWKRGQRCLRTCSMIEAR